MLFLISLVLIQQGKGADAGVVMGAGASESILGAGSAGNFISKLTTSTAIAFMITSILLVRSYNDRGFTGTQTVADPLKGSVMEGVAVEQPVEEAVKEEAVPAKETVEAKPVEAKEVKEEAKPVVEKVAEEKARS